MVAATQSHSFSTSFDFEVEKVPLVTNDGLKTNACAVVRRDTNRVLSTVSRNYQLVPNRELVDFVGQVIHSLGMNFTTEACALRKGARLFAKYTITSEFDVGDEGARDFLKPTVILQNSYNGKRGVTVDIGLFRLACSNGMVIGETIHKIRTRHYLETIKFEPIQNTLKEALENVPVLVESYRKMRSRQISMEKFTHIIGEVKDKISRCEKKQNEFKEFCWREFHMDKDQNLWRLYNVLTYYVTHRMKNELRKFSIYQHIDRTARRF